MDHKQKRHEKHEQERKEKQADEGPSEAIFEAWPDHSSIVVPGLGIILTMTALFIWWQY
jgi:hypothetical protein